MQVTYLKSTDEQTLLALKKSLRNMLKPTQGREAVEAYTTDEGVEIEAQPAIGDTGYWYSSFLAGFSFIPDGCEEADEETVKDLCGTWSGY